MESFHRHHVQQDRQGVNAHIRKALYHISCTTRSHDRISAREVGLSPNYFATLFRQKVGESFHTYLLRVRVEEGKQLLLSTRDPLTDIAVASVHRSSHFAASLKLGRWRRPASTATRRSKRLRSAQAIA